MSELKVTGKIIAIMGTQQVTDTFSKREFVIETDEQYPQMVKFEFTQAKCSVLDHEKIGNNVTVNFNLRGRKWTNKQGEDVYFNTLQAWRLESATNEQYSGVQPPFRETAEEPPVNFANELPF